MITLQILLFLLCLAVSFLLSGMEAGVLALSRLRIRHWMRMGNPRARALHGYLENPEPFLWTILVGNTIANVIAGSLGVLALHAWLGRWPVLLITALAGAVVLFYAFLELLPKTLFRMFPNRLCLVLATPFRIVHLLLKPLVTLLSLLSRGLSGARFRGPLFGNRHELRLLIQDTEHDLTREERLWVSKVLDLQNLQVRDLAVPWDRVTSVTTDTPVAQMAALCRERGFNRLPVWQTHPKQLAGLVNVRSVLSHPPLHDQQPVGAFVKPALYLPADMRLEEALRQMQRHHQRLAVVTSPDPKQTGVISLEDILKTIFGEISL